MKMVRILTKNDKPKITKISKTMRFFTKLQNISIYNFGSKNTKYFEIQKLFLNRQARKNYFWTAKPEKTFLDRQVRKSIFGLPSPIKKFGPPSPKKPFLDSQVRKNWTAKFEIFGNFIWKIPFTPGRPPTKFGITSFTFQKPSTTWRRLHSLKFGRPQLNLGNTYLHPGKFISIKYVCQ